MSLEFNKAAAAVLVTGIVVMVSGMVAELLVHPKELEENAYKIEGVEVVAGAVAPEPAKIEIDPVGPLLASASVDEGKKVFRKCSVCHAPDKGGRHKVGPKMWDVVGASKGVHDDYPYSKAMAEFPGEWGYEELNKFLYKPRTYIPGTKMVYAGLRKAEDRANLIAYLRTLSDNPKPLP